MYRSLLSLNNGRSREPRRKRPAFDIETLATLAHQGYKRFKSVRPYPSEASRGIPASGRKLPEQLPPAPEGLQLSVARSRP